LLRVTTLDCWQPVEPGAWMVHSRLYLSGINSYLPSMPNGWLSEATPTGELGGQEKPDWLGGQQPDERGSDEEVQLRKSLSRVCECSVLSVY
ncbi:hypothetical protein T08_12759, partial [Trichinella sp. T8]